MNKTCLKAFPCVPLLFLTIVGAWFVFHSHKGGVALAVAAQTCGQWSIIPSANPNSSNVLFGVAVISANDVWAVGNGVSKEGDSRALAEQWNGRTWKAVTTPGGAGNYLRDVVALSANNVWAVGDDQHNAKPESTLIEQWNGTAWRVIASPNAGTAGDFLFHVSAASANDIWAVGYDANSTTYRTFIEHWDGTAWKIIPSPNLNNSESGNSELNTLNSVAVVSPNDVWAVGDVELSNNSGSNHMLPEQTLIEHWNGSRWSIVASPNPDALGDGLSGMAAISATNIWAV